MPLSVNYDNISDSKKKIILLLNNARDLMVHSSDRESARKVVVALKEYANQQNISIPEEEINSFLVNLLDCRTETLSYLLTVIASKFVQL